MELLLLCIIAFAGLCINQFLLLKARPVGPVGFFFQMLASAFLLILLWFTGQGAVTNKIVYSLVLIISLFQSLGSYRNGELS